MTWTNSEWHDLDRCTNSIYNGCVTTLRLAYLNHSPLLLNWALDLQRKQCKPEHQLAAHKRKKMCMSNMALAQLHGTTVLVSCAAVLKLNSSALKFVETPYVDQKILLGKAS